MLESVAQAETVTRSVSVAEAALAGKLLPATSIPTFSLPIASTHDSAALDALAETLERSPRFDESMPFDELPFKLSYSEQPHWPTEMAMADYGEIAVAAAGSRSVRR